MKTYQTYLFDFDYTLADSSKGIVMCYRNVLERHHHTGISDEAIKRTIGKTLVESFSLLSGITDADTLEAYRKEYVKEADKYMTANTRLFPETSHVLATLKARGAKLGIISTKYRYRIMELLGHALPESTIDLIVGGEDVQTPKPSPEGVFIALEKLQTEKTDVLYVGDSTVDAETARAAGIDCRRASRNNHPGRACRLSAYRHYERPYSIAEKRITRSTSIWHKKEAFNESLFFST